MHHAPHHKPEVFDIRLPSIPLEYGRQVDSHIARFWMWGSTEDHASLRENVVAVGPNHRVRRTRTDAEAVHVLPKSSQLDDRPTVLIMHALTGDAYVGGQGGWWESIIGPGKALDPTHYRLICVNNLGSCYGSAGPADHGFPMLEDHANMPVPITTWDQANAILQALDVLGISRVSMAIGGSIGGMITLCLAALDPDRFERIMPVAACEAASPWIIGWNHIARSVLLDDPGYPEDASYGLVTARALAMLTYRAEAGLQLRQGRQVAREDQRRGRIWHGRQPYAIQTYLDYQGDKLYRRFDARAYIAQLDAMDHHDIARVPQHLVDDNPADWVEDAAQVLHGSPERSWGLSRIRASTLSVGVDTDELFLPSHSELLVRRLRSLGRTADISMLRSAHGHDAFLIELDQLSAAIERGLALPAFHH